MSDKYLPKAGELMDKSRSDFEKWWIENSAVNDVDSQGYLKKDENGDYLYYHIDAGWLLWQASRAVDSGDGVWTSPEFGGSGISKLDYFAAKAMQAIYMRAGGSTAVDSEHTNYIAEHAYAMAYAMLKESEK